jgi:hypothetical protein
MLAWGGIRLTKLACARWWLWWRRGWRFGFADVNKQSAPHVAADVSYIISRVNRHRWCNR